MKIFQYVVRPFLRFFISGALALMPIAVTIAVVVWVANFLAQYVGPSTFIGEWLTKIGGENANQPSWLAYLVGWLIVMGLIFLFGVFIELGAKKYFRWFAGFLFGKIPIIGSLYDTSQKFVELFEKSDDVALKGMSAVFCFFGNEGPAVLAFLASPKVFTIEGREYQIVVIPTAPVPFGGGMLFVPVEHVKPANMSVDGLMSTYVSMGVTADRFVATRDEDSGNSIPPGVAPPEETA